MVSVRREGEGCIFIFLIFYTCVINYFCVEVLFLIFLYTPYKLSVFRSWKIRSPTEKYFVTSLSLLDTTLYGSFFFSFSFSLPRFDHSCLDTMTILPSLFSTHSFSKVNVAHSNSTTPQCTNIVCSNNTSPAEGKYLLLLLQ